MQDPAVLPTREQIDKALQVEIFDKDGKKFLFGDLIKDRKVAVLFIRHFWCGICQAYISKLASSIPPQNLPSDTSIIIIGCGKSTPIQRYIDLTKSPYPIYANPDVELYKIFNFIVNLKISKKGEEKEYEQDLGGQGTRLWNAMKEGPWKNLGHYPSVGPISQNGGELIIQADGTCSYFHRMQHTADHTDLNVLAKELGAQYTPIKQTGGDEAITCESGVKV